MWWSEMRARSFFLAIAVGVALSGCKGKPPSKAESNLIWGWKHHLSIGGKKERNPLPVTPQTIADGRQAFSYYCAACHGLDGQNTGVPFADHMSPPVPSLASKDVQQYKDGQLKWIIDNGIWPSGMPGSSGTLGYDEIWSIVIYIRHLPKAGSLGDPPMYNQ
jgi:mono/diheme cytochrome c family protein